MTADQLALLKSRRDSSMDSGTCLLLTWLLTWLIVAWAHYE